MTMQNALMNLTLSTHLRSHIPEGKTLTLAEIRLLPPTRAASTCPPCQACTYSATHQWTAYTPRATYTVHACICIRRAILMTSNLIGMTTTLYSLYLQAIWNTCTFSDLTLNTCNIHQAKEVLLCNIVTWNTYPLFHPGHLGTSARPSFRIV